MMIVTDSNGWNSSPMALLPQPSKLEMKIKNKFQQILSTTQELESCLELVFSQRMGRKVLQAAIPFLQAFGDSFAKRTFVFGCKQSLQLPSFFLEALKKDSKTIGQSITGCDEDVIPQIITKEQFCALLGYLYYDEMERLEPAICLMGYSLDPASLIWILNYYDFEQLEQAIVELKLQVRRLSCRSGDDLMNALRWQSELQNLKIPAVLELLKNEFACYFGKVLAVAPHENILNIYKERAVSALSFSDVDPKLNVIDDDFLTKLASLDTLQYLDISNCTTYGPNGLSQLPLSLKELDMHNAPFPSSSDWLERLSSLRVLNVRNSSMLASHLIKLPRGLVSLNLSFCKITGDGMKDLPPNLLHLNLISTQIEEKDLLELPRGLKELQIYCPLSDTAIARLPATLTRLSVLGRLLTDRAIASLPRGLSTLELEGSGCNFTNEALKHLPPTLTNLSLSDCNGFQGQWLKLLPRTLKTLKFCYVSLTSLKELPEGLVTLDLWGINNQLTNNDFRD